MQPIPQMCYELFDWLETYHPDQHEKLYDKYSNGRRKYEFWNCINEIIYRRWLVSSDRNLNFVPDDYKEDFKERYGMELENKLKHIHETIVQRGERDAERNSNGTSGQRPQPVMVEDVKVSVPSEGAGSETPLETKETNQSRYSKGRELDEGEIDKKYFFATKPWRHQYEAFQFAYNKFAVMLAMDMGCVSCDTEFLSPTGWKRIDEWIDEPVGQYDADTEKVTFIKPKTYIKLPCKKMYHFKHTRGLDQMLSPEHKIIWFNHTSSTQKINSAEEIAKLKGGVSHIRFKTTFKHFNRTRIDLTEDQLRLQVAVIADGHFPCKTKYCIIRVKKKRKIKRLKNLLKKNEIKYKLRIQDDGFHCFTFYASIRCKVFTKDFWKASNNQRKIICDEVGHWDGSFVKSGGINFYTMKIESAHFIQFCFVSTGRRASLIQQYRKDRNVTEYIVHAIGIGRTTNFVNLGHATNIKTVRSPDGYKYCFGVDTGFLVLRRNGCVFVTGNCGKTKTAIDLMENRRHGKTLIVCPKAVMPTWVEELETHGQAARRILPLKGSVTEKEEQLSWAMMEGDLAIITNYESLIGRKKGKVIVPNPLGDRILELAKDGKIDCVIGDELHKCKAFDSKISLYFKQLGRLVRWRIGLTGTPFHHSPLDIYGQYRFLDPSIYPPFYRTFKQFYALTDPNIKGRVLEIVNQDDLNKKFYQIAFRVKADDVLDLPEEVHEKRIFELGSASQKIYSSIEKEFKAVLEDGEVNASNAFVWFLRLQQITAGFTKLDDDTTETEIGEDKKKALTDVLNDIPREEPVVVFSKFTHDLDAIKEVAKKMNFTCDELSGRVNEFEKWKSSGGSKILACQIKSGKEGISMVKSRYCIYFSHGLSMGDYQQSKKRLLRPGQTRSVVYIHLLAKDTIDQRIHSGLLGKEKLAESLLSSYKEK